METDISANPFIHEVTPPIQHSQFILNMNGSFDSMSSLDEVLSRSSSFLAAENTLSSSTSLSELNFCSRMTGGCSGSFVADSLIVDDIAAELTTSVDQVL